MTNPVTVIDLWFPKYFGKEGKKNWEFWPACYRVDYASTSFIKVIFSKAKHMNGLGFTMKKGDIQKYPKRTNGKISCYAVPMSAWQPVEKPEDWKRDNRLLKESEVNKLYPNIHEIFFENQVKLL